MENYTSSFDKYIIVMRDGTIKQTNPLTGQKSWSVPGRSNRPVSNQHRIQVQPLVEQKPENYCNFCEANYLNTPPEKERTVLKGSEYNYLKTIDPEKLSQSTAVFRRVPNLYAIVTYDYWVKNYRYEMSKENSEWKERYLASQTGWDHIKHMLSLKADIDLDNHLENKDWIRRQSEIFFGSCHHLIIAQRHFVKGAKTTAELASSGTLTPEEHGEFFKACLHGIADIYNSNRYIRYVSVFQNWLAPAGATFDHLHKQIIGLDEWGVEIEKEVQAIQREPHVYNMLVVNYAQNTNRIIAENPFAIAMVDIGHLYPTLAIYSKSKHTSPLEHSEEEVRGMSDMVHAIHQAIGYGISCNEEWYHQPKDCLYDIPWHILIKLRLNTLAGLEGGTRLHINPVTPFELRDRLVNNLLDLRKENKIQNIDIGLESPCEANCLLYYKKNSR